MAPPRIILCGDILGHLKSQPALQASQLSEQISGSFRCYFFCVGRFFPDEPYRLDEFMDYVEGRAQIPVPTFFIGDYGIRAAKILSSISKNSANQVFKMDGFKVFWLKGSGKFTLHGLSVAYLSGRRLSNGQRFGKYSQDDIDTLRAFVTGRELKSSSADRCGP